MSLIKPQVHNIATPQEEDRATTICNITSNIGKDRMCSSVDRGPIRGQGDTQSHPDRCADRKSPAR